MNGFALLALACLASFVFAEARITVHPMAADVREADALIPWVTDGDFSWSEGEPLFRTGENNDPAAAGWVAASQDTIRIKVVVQDGQHVNRQADGSIWDGDCIQLGVDLSGAGAPGAIRDEVHVGPRNASITFALTERGAKAWAHAHGRPDGAGAMPQLAPSIERDEAAKTTTYRMQIPWSEFGAKAGLWPEIGLAFHINDTDDGEPKQRRITWGDGGAGQLRPGLFKRLRLGPAPRDVVAVAITRGDVYQESDFAEVAVAHNTARTLRARLVLGEGTHEIDLAKAERATGFTRSVLRIRPGVLPTEATPLEVRILDAATGQSLAVAEGRLADGSPAVHRLLERLRQLGTEADESLMVRHYDSLRTQLMAEWYGALQVSAENPQPARECAEHAARILERLEGRDFPWALYADGQRDLVIGFRASSDNTPQFYLLRLPKAWDRAKSYPVLVFLHGTGHPHPLAFISGTLDDRSPDDEGRDYIRIMPWGRGNRGYEGYAGQDVFDSLRDAGRWIGTDPDQIYLAGFSMGGAGTWALGVSRPDLWAAIAVCAGGPRYLPVGAGLGMNLAHTPVILWHGDSDGAIPVTSVYALQRELQSHGNEPTMMIVPGLGHRFSPAVMEDIAQRLMQHRRKRPASFRYIAANRFHRSAHGITLEWPYDANPCPLPRVDVRLDGQNVAISASGTPKIQVLLGREGLGLAGDVKVSLNGEGVYEGPAGIVNLEVGRDPE